MDKLNLVFCGDTSLDYNTKEINPFFNVNEHTKSADVAFCNLECCLSDNPDPNIVKLKKNVIYAKTSNVEWLVESGFHITNIANNHIFDLGQDECINTIKLLKKKGLYVTGLKEGKSAKPVIIKTKSSNVGFLSYADYGFPNLLMPLRKKKAVNDVKNLSRLVDITVVSLHWGYEYVNYPSPGQQKFARKLVDSGANLVIGHHPHVIQGVEEYKDSLIAYSLGNFLFSIDEMPTDTGENFRHCNFGFMLSITMKGSRIVSYECIPVSAYQKRLVTKLSGTLQSQSLSRIKKLSYPLISKKIPLLFWLKKSSPICVPHLLDAWKYRISKYGKDQILLMIKYFLKEPLYLAMLILYSLYYNKQSRK